MAKASHDTRYDCIFAYVYVCICVCTYVCMHICMYVLVKMAKASHSIKCDGMSFFCIFVCMHVCMYACTYVCMYACTHVWMYECEKIACMHIYTYAHIHVRTYARTHFACILTCLNEEMEMAKVSHHTTYGCVPAHLYVWTNECVYVCMCVCMYV